ncbi:unnamed protein product [Diatraea saccharalis]|uniref:Uncharacterized protein n=1 Tax=Diatraea saccharalis TaxID=40085 RepID=A0A9N9N261_9NEOP|nr:unnamed protein product [Diatraea saccharalis]
MEYQHQPLQPLGPPAPPPQLLPPAPPPPLPSLPQLQHAHAHAHAQEDDRWNQYHIWRQHVFVNGQCCARSHQEAPAHFLPVGCCPREPSKKEKVRERRPISDATFRFIESSLFR